MNPLKLYLLHFSNINKLYDEKLSDKKIELASRVPGFRKVRSKTLLDILWCVMVIIEPFFSLLTILYLFPIFICKSVITKNQTIGNHIALCYSGLTRQRIFVTKEVYETIDYYLYPIFVDKVWLMDDKPKHCIFENLNMMDVIKAFFWSFLCIIAATIKVHGVYIYRNYVSFEYILTYYWLNKCPQDSTLYFVNHLDRWAVLFNNSCQHNKVLMQHGIEYPIVDWPVKLSNVNTVYLFSKNQKESMIKGVLGREVNFKYMPPTIMMTEMPNSKRKNLVIVAGENYAHFNNEEIIIKGLKDEDMMIFIKIHPGQSDYTKYELLKEKVNNNIEVISKPVFPKASAVVSYRSTLGVEYEALNIPVLYYDEFNIETIIQRIKTV